MDDLLREFLTETDESLDVVDVELVRFEQEPNNAKILDNIFRLVHTIKGTCGFLGLPRLEALAHAAETLMGKFRDGMPVTGEAVTLILATIDRIKDDARRARAQPGGAGGQRRRPDRRARAHVGRRLGAAGAGERPCRRQGRRVAAASGEIPAEVLERPPCVRGEAVARRAASAPFRETPVQIDARSSQVAPLRRAAEPASDKPDTADAAMTSVPTARSPASRSACNVDTLEHLMTMVSELVLTRNQLSRSCAATRTPNSRRRCSGSPTSPPSCRKAS